jgi:tetratricopeptide (TPR) repeat protein
MHARVPTAAALHVVAAGALRRGHREFAERLWRRALTAASGPGGSGSRYLEAHCLAGLCAAEIHAGRYGQAGELAARGLALVGMPRRRRNRLLVANLHNHAGIAARLAGHHDQALRHYDAALSGYRAAGRGRSGSAAVVWHNLGGLAFADGRLGDAERLTLRAVRLNRWSPIRRAADLGMLGAILAEQGRLDDGERLLRAAVAAFRQRYGDLHREIAFAQGNLAEVRRRLGASDDAQRTAAHALAVGERTLGPGHPELTPILTTLALLSEQRGDTGRAHELFARADRVLDGSVVDTHPARRNGAENLARLRSDDPTPPARR